MTWTDDHGLVHLCHTLDKEIYDAYQQGYLSHSTMMKAFYPEGEPFVRAEAPQIPRHQTYCGVLVNEGGDAATPPTCMSCLRVEHYRHRFE